MPRPRTLTIADGLKFPLEVVTHTSAIVGQRGTGKTSTAVVFVEEAAKVGAPFVVIDPTGAWYGLRSSADGKGAGLDVVILGGHNGDLPLSHEAGEHVARLVIATDLSVVLDLERMTKGQQVQFVAEFAETLYHLNRTVRLVVIDEAHRFSPQALRDPGGYGARCLGAVSDVVTLGRRKGLGAVLVSQRPAKIHKDVLEQAEVMFAHRLMGPNDRKALAGWMEEAHVGQDGPGLAELPNLTTGEAIVWAPAFDFLGRVQVRPKRTFDSSATPEVGARVIAPKGRADVDLAAIEAQLGEAVEQARAEDPRALRERVRELEAALQAAAPVDDLRMLAEELEGAQADRNLSRSELDDIATALGLDKNANGRHGEILGRVRELLDRPPVDITALSAAHGETEGHVADMLEAATLVAKSVGRLGVEVAGLPRADEQARRPVAPRERDEPHRALSPQTPVAHRRNGDGPAPAILGVAARDILTALGAFEDGLTIAQIALLTGRRPRGGSWNTALKQIKDHGFAVEDGERLVVTPSGRRQVPDTAPLSRDELVARWRASLPTPAQEILDILLKDAGREVELVDLAEMTGRQPRGGSWNTAIKALRESALVLSSGTRMRINDDLAMAATTTGGVA